MNKPPEALYAWIADGEDSFCAVRMGAAWMPLVGSRLENMTRFRELVQRVAAERRAPVRLYRYGGPDSPSLIETVNPQ